MNLLNLKKENLICGRGILLLKGQKIMKNFVNFLKKILEKALFLEGYAHNVGNF